MTVLNLNATDHLTAKMFFDEGGPIGVVRYDEVKYPFLKKLAKNMRGFYWTPEEIDVNKDRSDFSKLPVHEQEIFTKSLLRVILLDSVQGRAPAEMFNPVTSLPELENLVTTWTFFENIHSESYTHIIQNVYATSKEVFMGMTTDPFIKECAEDISKHYDDYAKMMYRFKAFGFGKFSITDEDGNTQKWNMTPYAIKKKLWLMLMSINALEGLRFYSNFAIFFNMAERSMMEGTAKLIRLICRDENLHLSATQRLLKVILPKDDPDFAKIAKECEKESLQIYRKAMEQEKVWIKNIFKNGSMIGLNDVLLSLYVDHIGYIRMKAVGLSPDFVGPSTNPLPFMNSWINAGTTQVAPQEVEQSAYVIGGINQDISAGTFSGYAL